MGCSDMFSDGYSEQVTSKINNDKLITYNNSSSTIYSIAMDQEFAASANWTPVSNAENAIQPRASKEVLLSTLTYNKPDSDIVVYYWTSKDPNSDDIRSILVER